MNDFLLYICSSRGKLSPHMPLWLHSDIIGIQVPISLLNLNQLVILIKLFNLKYCISATSEASEASSLKSVSDGNKNLLFSLSFYNNRYTCLLSKSWIVSIYTLREAYKFTLSLDLYEKWCLTWLFHLLHNHLKYFCALEQINLDQLYIRGETIK